MMVVLIDGLDCFALGGCLNYIIIAYSCVQVRAFHCPRDLIFLKLITTGGKSCIFVFMRSCSIKWLRCGTRSPQIPEPGDVKLFYPLSPAYPRLCTTCTLGIMKAQRLVEYHGNSMRNSSPPSLCFIHYITKIFRERWIPAQVYRLSHIDSFVQSLCLPSVPSLSAHITCHSWHAQERESTTLPQKSPIHRYVPQNLQRKKSAQIPPNYLNKCQLI